MTEAWSRIRFTTDRQRAIIQQLVLDLRHGSIFLPFSLGSESNVVSWTAIGKGIQDLLCHQNPDLDLVYVTGRLPNRSGTEVFVPLASDQSFTTAAISCLQTHLLDQHKTCNFTFSLMDEDSTTVYYRVTPGLVTPSEPHSELEL